MLRPLQASAGDAPDEHWLPAFWADFRRRFLALLGYQFRAFSTGLALSVLSSPAQSQRAAELERAVLEEFVSAYDLRRLELYATNMADYHLITDLLPAVARLFLLGRFGNCHLSPVQTVSHGAPLERGDANRGVLTARFLWVFRQLVC